MAEIVESLLTKWTVDPSEGIRGLDLSERKITEFRDLLQRTAQSLPELNVAQFMRGANVEIDKSVAHLRALQQEAQVTARVLAALDAANPPGPMLGPQAPPVIITDKVAQLKLLSAQLQKSGADAQQFAASMSKMNISLLAGASGRIGDGGRSFDRGLANLRAQTAAVAGGFNLAQQGGSRLINTLGSLAVTSVGVSGKLATLASNLLVFGVGGTGVAALALTALAASKAWEVYTASQKKAAEAAKETADALDRLAQQQKGPVVQARERFDAQRVALEGVTRELARVAELRQQAAGGGVGGGIDKSLAAEIRLRAEQAELLSRVTTESERLAVAQRALNEATFARGNEMLRDLSIEAATFGMTATEARKFAVVMDRDLTDAQRSAALSILNTIGALERQDKALREAIEADKAAKESRAQLTAAYNAFWDDIEAKANLGAAKIAATWAKLIADQKAAASEGLTGDIGAGFDRAQARTDLILDPPVIAFEKLVEEIRRSKEEARQLADATKAARTEAELLADTFTDIGSAAFALADVGYSLGIIGDEAARSLGDVGRLSDALADVAKSASTGSILGAISAGAGLLGGLFNKDKNPERFKGNEDLFRRAVEGDQRAIDDLLSRSGRSGRKGGGAGGVEGLATKAGQDDAYRKYLEATNQAAKLGEELARSAAAEEAQRVAAELLEQASRDAADRLREAAEASRRARDAFIAQQMAFEEAARQRTPGLLELRRQLTGTDNPQQQLSDALQPLRDTFGGGPLGDIVKGFSGFNLDDPAAREALSQRVLEYVNKLLSGQSGIPPELIDTFVGAMGDITGILGGFADAANQATRSLSNVPQSINIAAYEFRAQAARARDVAAVTPVDPKKFLPNVDTVTGRTGGSRPLNDLLPTPIQRIPAGEDPVLKKIGDLVDTIKNRGGAGGTVTIAGDIVIQGGSSVPPAELARQLREELKRIAMRTTGNPDDWGAT